MPLFFAVLGLWLFREANRERATGAVLNLLSGAALAVSAGAKVSYFFVPLVVGLYALSPIFPLPLGPRLRRVVVPLAAGGLLGGAPLLYYAWLDFEAFWYGVYGFHVTGPIEYYQRIGLDYRFSNFDIVTHFFKHFTQGTVLGASGLGLYLLLLAGRERRLGETFAALRRSHGLLVLALVVVATPACLIIRPSWANYYLPAIPFFALAVVFLFTAGEAAHRAQAIPAVFAVSLATAVPGLSSLAEAPLRLADRSGWAGAQVHDMGRGIAAALEAACLPAEGKVATLWPMYVIDGGGKVYREFATGPFFYRSGNLLDPEQVKRLAAASPETLEALLDSDPPVAILTGFEPGLDEGLERFAAARGYARADADLDGGRLFLMPGPEECPGP
jgi:hypothetical protein